MAMSSNIHQLGEPAAFPSRLSPMLARLVDEPLSNPDWLFEAKLDGFRALAFIRRGGVSLRSRNNNDLTTHFPHVASELKSGKQDVLLDGEMVTLNEQGLRTST